MKRPRTTTLLLSVTSNEGTQPNLPHPTSHQSPSKSKYADSIVELIAQGWAIMDKVAGAGLEEDTLILLDDGPRGLAGCLSRRRLTPFRGRGRCVGEPGRLAWWPGKIGAGSRTTIFWRSSWHNVFAGVVASTVDREGRTDHLRQL